jgi:hypothetical protein
MGHVLSAAKIIAQRHDARTSYERRVYLKLARAWLEAALVDDDAPQFCRQPHFFK